MSKSFLLAVVVLLFGPPGLHAQSMGRQGGAHAGHEMQMQAGQSGDMMHRNLVRDVMAESAALGLSAVQMERLEPLAARLDGMFEVFRSMHGTGEGRMLAPAAHDSIRAAHMEVRRTNEEEVLKEVKAVLGLDLYVRALELLVVRRGGMN